jgi:hypothetical protein
MPASWISGSLSGVSASALLQPFDMIRTQMQKNVKGGSLNTRQAFRKVGKPRISHPPEGASFAHRRILPSAGSRLVSSLQCPLLMHRHEQPRPLCLLGLNIERDQHCHPLPSPLPACALNLPRPHP